MIPTIRLKSGIVTSRLGFGTSRLHYLGANERQRLLAEAASLGFLHFDTAPLYGDGLAETELGRFPGRNGIIVATKYGMPEDPIIAALPSLGFPLRAARSIVRKAGFWRMKHEPITVLGLRKSIERSLRRLNRNHIDILLLHEPTLQSVAKPAEVATELESLRARGLIRAFGIAGGWNGLAPLLAAEPKLSDVVQTAESEWPPDHVPDITYSAIHSGAQNYASSAAQVDEALTRLKTALEKRPGVVLVSTTKPTHLRQLASAAGAHH